MPQSVVMVAYTCIRLVKLAHAAEKMMWLIFFQGLRIVSDAESCFCLPAHVLREFLDLRSALGELFKGQVQVQSVFKEMFLTLFYTVIM